VSTVIVAAGAAGAISSRAAAAALSTTMAERFLPVRFTESIPLRVKFGKNPAGLNKLRFAQV
jgi:hypothetical protein